MGRKRTKEAEDRHIELGKQLKEARNAGAQPHSPKIRDRSQKAVAKKLGWSTSMVAKMETGLGTPSPFRLRALADYYSKPLMPWLRLLYGKELIDVILGAHREEESAKKQKLARGVRLFKVAGRPTRKQFILVYGKKGPGMTWKERTAAGVPAEKFQDVLRAKQQGKSV